VGVVWWWQGAGMVVVGREELRNKKNKQWGCGLIVVGGAAMALVGCWGPVLVG
jgi:hypothetical protein